MSVPNAGLPTYTERFARFVRNVRFEDLSPGHVARIKDCIRDQIGVQLVGSTLPWTRIVYDYAREIGGSGACTVVGTTTRLSAPEAAFVNATFGHGCELDDVGHAGVAVIPAALAVAEQLNATGREFLTTVALGYEIFFRLFDAVMPQILERGFHQQVVLGVFSSAAVAGRLLGLTEDQLVHAFGVAGSHASATAEYDQSGGEVKRMHAGLGARGGVQSALLARRGLTGPRPILEGQRGIFRTFVAYAREEGIAADLGQKFVFEPKIAFKMYPAVASVHTAIEALGQLIDKYQIKPKDVRQIRVGIREYALMHGAAIVAPSDVLSAQFSLAFSLALRLVIGRNDLDLYMNEKLWTDENIVQVSGKVTAYADPSAKRDRLAGSLVSVEMNDGRKLEQYVQHRKGTPQNPATKVELMEKFVSLAESVLQHPQIDEVVRVVDRLEHADSVRPLTALLVAPQ
ncbi:MAG: MmgE/PrpD family protein [Betaproteobacteria bacterium]|nr:MmgE/PrpD family protein [Betaproteobacteria bacterium]